MDTNKKHLQWINILHLYQPPTQSKEQLDTIIYESYSKILDLLKTYPNLKLTINFSGSLLEQLDKYKHTEVIKSYREFAEQGRIELVGSAMYHPILPLLSGKEMERQIELNNKMLRKHFGKAYNFQGFYIPEMAYSHKVARLAKRFGFGYIILDEVHNPNPTNPKVHYKINKVGISVIFRNSEFSRSFPPEFILQNKDKLKDNCVITAHDGELYGHWHKDDKGFYQKIFTDPTIETKTVSEYLAGLTETATVEPREASWESTADELSQNIPYGLWKHPANKIHKKLEALKKLTLKTVEQHRENPHYALARKNADRGIASCAWWWASERQLGPFSPLTWNPTEVEKGAQELLTAVRSLKGIDPNIRLKAEDMFNKVHTLVWEKHWKDHNNQ